MKLIVDRIEGDIAVCERQDMSKIEIKLSALPDGIKEGSVVLPNEDGTYSVAPDLTMQRKNKISALSQRLAQRSKKS